MTGWIRWPGFVAFVALAALLIGMWSLLIDVIVERGIEHTGTAVVGARVELQSADVSLWPAGVELHGLQVTDPEHPMTNAIEVERIAGLFDALEALRRKVIVHELAVEGVRFGTPRKRSGAVSGGVRQKLAEAAAVFELPSFEFPDPAQILAEEELESVALIRNLRKDIDESQERWKHRLEALPGQEDLDRYRKRINELSGGGVENIARAVQLADDIRKDLALLKKSAGGFEEEFTELQERVRQAQQAPARDLARLQERYGLSDAGLANLSGRLLGARVQSLVDQSLGWYRRLEPFFARASQYVEGRSEGEGPEVIEQVRGNSVRVRFREDHPTPDFLIRHSKVSIELEGGAFSGTIDNVTPDQHILGAPLVLAFGGEKLKGIGSIHLDGKFDYVRPERTANTLVATVRGFEVNEFVLSESERWPISVDRGRADLQVRANLAGDALSAKIDLALADAVLKTGFADTSAVAGALAKTLEGVSAFELGADVSGTLDDFAVKIRSDLDRLLGGAVKNLVSAQMKQFQAKLGAGIEQKVGEPLSALGGSLGGLEGIEGDFTKRLEAATSLLGEAQTGGAGPLKGLKLPGGLRFP